MNLFISAMCPNTNTTGGGVRPFYHMKNNLSTKKKTPYRSRGPVGEEGDYLS